MSIIRLKKAERDVGKGGAGTDHPIPVSEATTPIVAPNTKVSPGSELTEGPIGRTLWRLAIPLAFGFVINAVYSWTDMYFVSRLGDEATAALGFSDQINFVLFTLGSGFCIGTGIVVARRIGENRRREATVIATQAFSFLAIYSTLVAVGLYFLLPHVLPLFGLTERVLEYATLYLVTLLFGFPANLLNFHANSTVRSTGNTLFSMGVLIFSAIINAILAPILIYGELGVPALGIKGAALATVTAQWCAAGISTYALYSGRLNIRLYPPTLRFDWGVIGTIFKVGVPSSLQTLAVSVSRVILISIAASFGTAAAAAYTIGLRVDILVFMPIFAAGIAIETLVSQNIGARRFDRVKKFRQAAIRHLGGVIVAMGIAIYFLAESIALIFTDNTEVIALTVRYLHIAVFGYLFFVVGQTATRALSGAGHSLRSMLIVAGLLLLLQVPLAYILSNFTELRETGVFLAITLSYLVLAVLGTIAMRGDKWMMKKV